MNIVIGGNIVTVRRVIQKKSLKIDFINNIIKTVNTKNKLRMEFNCEKCDYHTNDYCNFTSHSKTIRHTGKRPDKTAYNCDKCKYGTNHHGTYRRHLKTKKHLKEEVGDNWKFNCDKCNYHTNNKSHYKKHLLSKKN